MEITVAELNRRLNHPENLLRTPPISSPEVEIIPEKEKPEGAGEELASVLENLDDLVQSEKRKGRSRAPNRDLETKAIIGTMAHFQSQTSIEALLGIEQASVSTYARGMNVTNVKNGENKALKDKLRENLGAIAALSSNVTLKALTNITDEKLKKLRATELARVAKDSSAVMERATGHKQAPQLSRVIVLARETKLITEYEKVPARPSDVHIVQG